jgi:predicted porin
MRKILLGTTGVVGAALIGMTTAQAQQAPTVRIGGYLQTTFAWVSDDLDAARGAPTGVNAANPNLRIPGTVNAAFPNGINSSSARRSTNDFRNEVEIHVFVTGKAANGLSYGAVVEIQNDNTGAGSGSGLDLDEAYVFFSTPTLGTIRFGEEDSAASIMQVRAPTITGFGADGAWDVGILGTANATGGNPSLLTGINDGNDATKVVYLSPQFFGVDFGISYAANAGEGDRAFFGRAVDTLGAGGTAIAPSVTQRDQTALGNEWSAALRYRGSFQNVGIAASFAAMRADAQRNVAGATSIVSSSTTTNPDQLTQNGVPNNQPAFSPGLSASQRVGYRFTDVTAYSVGAQLTAFGFTLGGEYTWGNYAGASVGRAPIANNPDGSKRDQSNHWLIGLTYTVGAWALGGYYGIGEQDNGRTAAGVQVADREQTGWGIGVSYTLAPGLELFASYNNVSDKNVNITLNGGTLVDRNYEGVFLGTRLAF